MLSHVLDSDDYALCLSPGFFRFYAHLGVLHALEESKLLKPKYIAGSSAGAMVGAFIAAGKQPSEALEMVLGISRNDFWDMGGIGGLLKGKLFQEKLETHIPVQDIENCPIPFAATAYDTIRCRTKKITSGSVATAARASCTFPGLFQPVVIDGTPHIDGGVWDWVGLLALDECILAHARRQHELTSPGVGTPCQDLETLFPANKLIVNVVFNSDAHSRLTPHFAHARLLTIVVENIPDVNPFTMSTMGVEAYKIAKAATHRALFSCHMQELASNHWSCYVDGKLVNSIPPSLIAASTPAKGTAGGGSRGMMQRKLAGQFIPHHTPDDDQQQQQEEVQDGDFTPALTVPLSRQASRVTIARSSSLSNTSSGSVSPHAQDTAEAPLPAATSTSSSTSNSNSSSMFPFPSLHLPEAIEHTMHDMIPSYAFINGTYFYRAIHHTVHQAGETLQHTLDKMASTMTSTLQTFRRRSRSNSAADDDDEDDDNNVSGAKRSRSEDDDDDEDEEEEVEETEEDNSSDNDSNDENEGHSHKKARTAGSEVAAASDEAAEVPDAAAAAGQEIAEDLPAFLDDDGIAVLMQMGEDDTSM